MADSKGTANKYDTVSLLARNNRRINLNEPRWDQSTYRGRALHFFYTTDPRNLLCTSQQLDDAKSIIDSYRQGKDLSHLSEDEIWKAKHIYDSAFHPDTGEKMILFGRMSAQVPSNMMITAAMLTFYKTTRSGNTPIPVDQLGVSYLSATTAALVTALGLNRLVRRAPPLLGRFVPFVAVAAANCINIPLMRQKELKDGIAVVDEQGETIGESKVAAKTAISQVVLSRIAMAAPGMLLPPLIMNNLEKRGTLKRFPRISLPMQTAMCGFLLVFATPMCCAIFPQKSRMLISKLEPEVQSKAKNPSGYCYFNKGL